MLSDAERLLNTLADRHYAAGDATRKASSYFKEYANLLGHRSQEPLKVLEIGVSSGASLLIWRDFLPNATIVGIDIAAPPPRIIGEERIHFLRGSQDDPALLDEAGEVAGGPFDLIVDDASHLGYLTKRSFEYLFPRWLSPGGTYVIEDFGTGFLPEYPDGAAYVAPSLEDSVPETQQFISHQFGMVGVVKQLVDHMMAQLMTGQRPRIEIERMTVLTNIAFLQKADCEGLNGKKPGGGAARAARDAYSGSSRERALEERLEALETELQRQTGRLTTIETSLRKIAVAPSDSQLP